MTAAPCPFLLHDEAETAEFARTIARGIRAGDTIALQGDLGAGKTTWTRAFVAALGSPDPVSSPTFTLLHEYAGGRLPVYHMDAYRIKGGATAEQAGLVDYLERGDGVCVVEWPDHIADVLPVERLEIALTQGDTDDARTVTVMGRGPRWANVTLPFAHGYVEGNPC